MIQANLVSALVSFTTQVKKDSLQSILMRKEQMLFHRQHGVIFVLVLDSEIRPLWVERPLAALHESFCQQYPSVPIGTDQSVVFDVTQFEPFKVQAADQLHRLDARLHLLLTLVGEKLLTEDEAQDADPVEWATKIAERLLQQTPNQGLQRKWKMGQRLQFVDTLLDRIEGGHIYRTDAKYLLECASCQLCQEPQACFYAEILETILLHLGLECEAQWDATALTRTIAIYNPGEED